MFNKRGIPFIYQKSIFIPWFFHHVKKNQLKGRMFSLYR